MGVHRLSLETGNRKLETLVRCLCALCVLCGYGFCIDREAFTFTDYNLTAKIDPGFHVLRAFGTVTLRNNSDKPQRIAVLQISSSLQWESIRILPTVSTGPAPAAPTEKEKSNGKPLQYLVQPYTSDIDHTGELTEAIVTLPADVPAHASVQLQIAYSGVIEPSTGRWDRVGLPKDSSQRNDWDRIAEDFTGIRGFGYVAWYPVATEAASVSDQAGYGETFSRFKSRHAATNFWLRACAPTAAKLKLLTNGAPRTRPPSSTDATCQDFLFAPLSAQIPTIIVAPLTRLDTDSAQIWHQPGHVEAARAYADAARNVRSLVTGWFGEPHSLPTLVELPDPAWSPYESGAMLFTGLRAASATDLQSVMVHPTTHTALVSNRLWIFEGAAHFAQALEREQQQARRSSAIAYMQQQYSSLAQVDREPDPNRSLITTYDELLFRAKGMAVFWMLRGMLGDAPLQAALKKYDAAQDKEPSYFQKLLEAESKKDLEWFFDDWVYRDRGLPDFKIDSVYTRQILRGGYLATVTVENLGNAAADVPIAVHFEHGDVNQRLIVKAREKASARVEVATPPLEVTVNDGSVPESDTSNNTYPVPPQTQ